MEPIEAFLIKDPRATTSLDLGLALSLGALRLPDPAPSVLSSVGEQRPSFTLIGKSNLVSPPCAHGCGWRQKRLALPLLARAHLQGGKPQRLRVGLTIVLCLLPGGQQGTLLAHTYFLPCCRRRWS